MPPAVPPPRKRRRTTVRPRAAGGALEASSLPLPCSAEAPPAAAAGGLPKIPGVPHGVLPVFLEALRTGARFFGEAGKHGRSFTIADWEKSRARGGRGSSRIENNSNSNDSSSNDKNHHHLPNQDSGVFDSLMNRMRAAEATAEAARSATSDRETTFLHALNKWMEEVRYVSKQQKQQEPQQQQQSQQPHPPRKEPTTKTDEKPRAVAYSIFLYLWDLQQDHKRIAVRRAALLLSGILLQRSEDCRGHLDQGTHLADWVSSVAGAGGTANATANANASAGASDSAIRRGALLGPSLLQAEAIALVADLLARGHGRAHERLRVAARGLAHRCSPPSGGSPMGASRRGDSDLRALRDAALKHGAREAGRVEGLLERAEEALLVLVPRFVPRAAEHGGGESNRKGNDKDNNGNGNGSDDDDDSESDIDWEDGDDGGDAIGSDVPDAAANANDSSHLSAVERTMAAMKTTSGTTLFQGGALEIDFDRRAAGEHDDGKGGLPPGAAEVPSREAQAARRRLAAIVRRLSERHLVCLTAWLDGLRNSDGLVPAGNNNNNNNNSSSSSANEARPASLVSLSREQTALRLETIERLSALKQDVSRVLSSAARLAPEGLLRDKADGSVAVAVTATAPVVPALGSAGGPALVSHPSRVPRRKQQHHRRRIEIRYHTQRTTTTSSN
ncbi:unnamed protein product [Pseudo-nitzschia multistriata]|uniref:Uncharacterized protein n=1 Tax=Pseudo-nitzschia multistriata TaxID=183589 RepID=A0A448ZBZ9_9STRA|nr:unnamed protein product [Pseudo-nitzschia multistriata]